MSQETDREILDRYHHRFARVEPEIDDPPPFPARQQTSSVRSGRVGANVSVVLIFAIAIATAAVFLRSVPSDTPPGTSSSPASVDTTVGSDEAEIVVRVARGRPTPSGLDIAPILDGSTFVARLMTTSGDDVATWPLNTESGIPMRFPASTYRLVVWRIVTVDDVLTGARLTTPPLDRCSVDVELISGGVVSVTARFTSAAAPCQLDVITD
jgi:hypothetical protein